MKQYAKKGVLTLRILGIDPGYAIVGFGVLEYDGMDFKVIDFGAITTPPKISFDKRLDMIYKDMSQIFLNYHPDCMSLEKLYFNTNHTTAIDVAQARGVILLAARQNSVETFEYTPLQVKNSVVGYGRAEKKQVQEMTRSILRLKTVPKPDDTADALALAITHGHCSYSNLFNINRTGVTSNDIQLNRQGNSHRA